MKIVKTTTQDGLQYVDGETILVAEGSHFKNIWGGAVDIKNRRVETLAVLNLRPSQGNDSMDILDPTTREKFINVVEGIISYE